MRRGAPFFWLTVSCAAVVMAFILLPLVQLMTAPSAQMLKETILDLDVLRSIWLSVYTAGRPHSFVSCSVHLWHTCLPAAGFRASGWWRA